MDLLMQLIIIIALLSLPATAVSNKCSDHCGNVWIPFPFGEEGCNLGPEFLITCRDSVPFLRKSNFTILNISLDGQLRIAGNVVGDCYDPIYNWGWDITFSNFSISKSLNKFTVIGCDSYAYLKGYRYFEGEDKFYSSGCITNCAVKTYVDDTSCSGSGCCQIEIPEGLYDARVRAYSFNNHTEVLDFNPCTYALIVEESEFKFTFNYLQNIPKDKEFPMVLEWTIINNQTNYCKDNSNKEYPLPGNIKGYRCKCKEGYDGNPYDGCKGTCFLAFHP